MTSTASDEPLGQHEQTSSMSARAATSELASIRRWARRVLEDQGAADHLVDDFELAASELATNVIRHTASATIQIWITRDTNTWILDVADAEHAPPPAARRLPPPDEPTGRGLYVVSSVMDRVDLVDVGGVRRVRCTRADPS